MGLWKSGIRFDQANIDRPASVGTPGRATQTWTLTMESAGQDRALEVLEAWRSWAVGNAPSPDVLEETPW